MLLKIVWAKAASSSFRKAILYIRKDSVQNAEKVMKDILHQIDELKRHPDKYPLDKYKTGNTGYFRAFELHHYRVSYAIEE
jgi:plasmid stabilization system protein ParE